MGNRLMLSVGDALACQRFVQELLELRTSPLAWRRHLVDGMERLLGGFGAGLIESQANQKNWPLQNATLSSSSDAEMERRFSTCAKNGDHTKMPGSEAFQFIHNGPVTIRISALGGGLPAYYRSDFYNRYTRPFGTGDTLSSLCFLSKGKVGSLTLLRERRDRCFDSRAEAMMELLIRAIAQVSESAPGIDLPPRLQQTLDRLLRGDSEKEIAANLALSPNTVHEHVGRLYRKLGVHSRAELMALYLHQGVTRDGGGRDRWGAPPT